jgi:superfamily I DNA/RNA helicase
LAGVGTGKTETLMVKYLYLATQGYEFDEMLAVTFSNKAAKEMKDRAC